MTLVVLTGIPGSGSTTILNKTLEKVYGLEPYTKECILSLCEKYACPKDKIEFREASS